MSTQPVKKIVPVSGINNTTGDSTVTTTSSTTNPNSVFDKGQEFYNWGINTNVAYKRLWDKFVEKYINFSGMSNSKKQQAYEQELQVNVAAKMAEFEKMTPDGKWSTYQDVIIAKAIEKVVAFNKTTADPDKQKAYEKEIRANLDAKDKSFEVMSDSDREKEYEKEIKGTKITDFKNAVPDEFKNNAYNNELAEGVDITFSQREGFTFVSDEFKKAQNGKERLTLYRRDALNAAESSIKLADTNHDGELNEREYIDNDKKFFYETNARYMDGNNDNVVSFEEYVDGYKNLHPAERIVPEKLKSEFEALNKDKNGVDLKTMMENSQLFNMQYDEEVTKEAFNIISQGQKTINPERMATLYYLMDFDGKNVDGKVPPAGYLGLTMDMKIPSREAKLSNDFIQAHDNLFGEDKKKNK